jgi:nicotinate-nucleotide pyrophosphorylase (carboxylating)
VRNVLDDGSSLDVGTVVAELTGPVRSLLAIERVALNFLTHLCGIATLTARYVAAVAGTDATICDTRKTLPGLRALGKYAVACGGGVNHRLGLHDAMLIKDNHLAHLPADQWQAVLSDAIERARADRPGLAFVEIEVDRIDQLRPALACNPDFVLLDNMSVPQLRQAVSIRDAEAPGVQLEASGGVTLETVRPIAEAGVDRISVGALTHSAPALDLAVDAL